MKKFDLQLFASAVPGKRIVYLFRRLSKQAEEGAWNLAFVTENGRTLSVDADSTATKDGSIRTPGVPEQEVTVTCVLSKGDTRVDETEDAILDGEKFEIWEANLEEAVTGSGNENKFKGIYFQGYGTEFEKNSNAEDMTEISLTFGLDGKGARGNVTVTANQQQQQAAYVFTDTPKATS